VFPKSVCITLKTNVHSFLCFCVHFIIFHWYFVSSWNQIHVLQCKWAYQYQSQRKRLYCTCLQVVLSPNIGLKIYYIDWGFLRCPPVPPNKFQEKNHELSNNFLLCPSEFINQHYTVYSTKCLLHKPGMANLNPQEGHLI